MISDFERIITYNYELVRFLRISTFFHELLRVMTCNQIIWGPYIYISDTILLTLTSELVVSPFYLLYFFHPLSLSLSMDLSQAGVKDISRNGT